MSNYKQLTYEQRCQIEALKISRLKQQAIADAVGVDQSTISRELNRNTGLRGYRHKQAQSKTDERRRTASKARKMTHSVVEQVERQIREQWSPEQVSGWLQEVFGMSLSHERIYLYIWEDKRVGGDLYTHLRRQGKKYQNRCNGKTSRGRIKNRVGIEHRPRIVEEKSRVGDWEIDTVIGKGHSGALVTIVESATQFTVSKRVNGKSAKDTGATISLQSPYAGAVHTITADNGKEFAFHEKITKALGAPVYFARAYHSWERGLSKNTNGLLRQYWPKYTDFKQVIHGEVRRVVNKINHRPRKTLGFKTPAQLMHNHLAVQAA